MFAQFFVQVFMLGIIKSAGNGDKAIGIEKVMTVLAIIGTIMLLITFLTTKERIIPKPEQKSSVKEDLGDLVKNKPWLIMLTLTLLVFITLAMKGGSYVYYFENYVDKEQLALFIQPILDVISNIGLNHFGDDPISAGFGLFNAGGIIFMIVGITLSKSLADKYGKRNILALFLIYFDIIYNSILFLSANICSFNVFLSNSSWIFLRNNNSTSLGNDC